MAKKPKEESDEHKSEEPKGVLPHSEYLLADPETASVSHGGVIYQAVNGKIACALSIALELIDAGVLKPF